MEERARVLMSVNVQRTENAAIKLAHACIRRFRMELIEQRRAAIAAEQSFSEKAGAIEGDEPSSTGTCSA